MLGLIALFFWSLPKLEKREFTKNKSFTVRDLVLLCALCAVYAFAAFSGLGDSSAPEAFAHFDKSETAVIDLGEETEVSAVQLYPVLNTGRYNVYSSSDGSDWHYAFSFDQDYVSLLKWSYAELDEFTARYISIVADSELYLGEVAVYSCDVRVPVSSEKPGLCDEGFLVPSDQSYMNSSYFDEIYHARTALEHLEGIYPYEVSHPPLGKLLIAAGISVFGMTPFGWRFTGVLFGVLMLPVMYALVKKMYGGSSVPFCAIAVFAFDFMHFTQTRIATIDTYAVFFILLMYLFMYLYLSSDRLRYLALCGISFGIGAACKWTCFYAGAGLALLWLVHWIRRLKSREERFGGFIMNCLFCVLFFVLIPAVIYYVSYYPYGIASGMHGTGMLFTRDYASIVWDNQSFMLSYHSGVHAEHPYSSRWYQWILDLRPILYYLKYFDDGTRSSFGAFLNPVLCWAGLAAMVCMAYLALVKRDSNAEFVLVGYLAQLLPWVFITRTTFEYHYFPSSVFLVLALAQLFALMRKNKGYRLQVGGFTALCVILFIAFYPVLSGARVDSALAGNLLQWLPSWPF